MFADDTERASEYEALATQDAIALAQRNAAIKRLPLIPGLCDICESDVDDDGNPLSSVHLFCSPDCRDTDAKERRLKAMRGTS